MSSTISPNGLAHRCFWLNWKFKLIEGSIADNRRELIDAGTPGVSTVPSAIDRINGLPEASVLVNWAAIWISAPRLISCFDRPIDTHENYTITIGV